MHQRHFMQCDVFSQTPTRGNALAVVIDGEGIDDATMQAFAAWTNLAETTFLLPPDDPVADYRVRIFTPVREMKFAGHPTLGRCACWLKSGGQPRDPGVVRQQCNIGIVEIDMTGEFPAFVAPPTTIAAMDTVLEESIIDTLKINRGTLKNTAQLENGPTFQAFELDSAAAVLALDSSRVRWPQFKAIGVIGAHPSGAPVDYEVRMLAPSSGMSEDPITGSLNAALAQWFATQGRLNGGLRITQGTNINREGLVLWQPDQTNAKLIRIGGHTEILIEGTINL